MNKKQTRLAERRESLIAQAAAQRSALGWNMEPLRAPLAKADRGLAALRYVRQHPVWLVGGVAALAALRRFRTGKWLTRGVLAWQMVRKLRGM